MQPSVCSSPLVRACGVLLGLVLAFLLGANIGAMELWGETGGSHIKLDTDRAEDPTVAAAVAAAGAAAGGQLDAGTLRDAWLNTLSEFAVESIPEGQRAQWWPNNGHIGMVPRQIARYVGLAADPSVKTICEVGFNAGHSAAVMMAANPGATFYSFDFMELAYSKRVMKLFRTLFPERFHFIRGSSWDGIPWFHKTYPEIKCELFSLDGDHFYPGFKTDVINAVTMIPEGGTLIADDVSNRFSGVKQAWEELVAAGYFSDAQCEEPQAGDHLAPGAGEKRWCWGKVKKPDQAMAAPNQPSGKPGPGLDSLP